MKEMWDERYAASEYVYGELPNQFLKLELAKLEPGKILLPAEGEGRNAVFAAGLGWQVTAFDISTQGKLKADKLATMNKVKIDYQVKGYEEFVAPLASFDCLALIYAHAAPDKRRNYHKKLFQFLKPGGRLILEGFSKAQINHSTGGPRNIDMLFSEEELRADFADLSKMHIEEAEVHLQEGEFHDGVASIIRVLGTR